VTAARLRHTALGSVVVAVLVGVMLSSLTAAPVAAEERTYAPVDQGGPALSVPAEDLEASLDCPDGVATGTEPVLLIPGTNLDPEANFSWNYLPAFAADERVVCTVALPAAGMDDIQVAAEHVVHAIREMASDAGGPVDIVGYSQGGMIGRWALRFWPDTRDVVDDLIGLAPSNHGTETAKPACERECVPAYHQQRSDAAFIAALNSYQETFTGVDYTVAYTWGDEVVTPNVGPVASSPVHGNAGRVSNIALQQICPGHVADHFTIGTTDPVGYAIVVDALDHDGPADPARIDLTVCAAPYMPGVDPASLPNDLAAFFQRLGEAYDETEPVEEEPPLRCYVTATCDVSASATVATAAPGTAVAGTAEVSRLPATGGGSRLVALAAAAWMMAAMTRRGARPFTGP
jgi:pimeloyl-ACP methyl ester carboxylesterase